ncbi:MAG TPA: alpha/beta hydrolase [Actinophytocola sp.]|jgi:pimeloyl-ACP methyl ester carboxylesterase|uniref:alpha/beta hydrolase n=1 Tax=Actinophytocola sp. TaxID=1872138 RepID=UPI002DFBD3F4|nr:alpha/beta hydrolase [Actinophytocola sp.]
MIQTRPLAGAAIALALLTGGVAAAEPVAQPAIHWAPCPGPAQPGAECATVGVPLDPTRPGAGTISLALARLPALDPASRIGALLLNPGGPGGSGVGAVAYDPALSQAPEFATVRQRFDIVGFDPRGVGASTPIACRSALHDPAVRPFPRTPAEFAALVRFNRQAGDGCRAATGPLIDHVDTLSVVADVEAIRRALRAERISWLGLSYGTEIGELYAERHPSRVRAMVLDGVVDHSLPARAAALDEARATETALVRFGQWCAGSDQCPLHGQDVLGVYDRVIGAAARGELPAVSLGRAVTAEEVTEGAYGLLQLRVTWPQLAAALGAAADSAGPADASGLMLAVNSLSSTYPAYRTVGCHDFAPATRGFPDLAAQAALLRVAAPHSWRYSEFWDWTSGCVGWPVPAANPPRPLRVLGAPAILLVNTRFDPATPYRWAQRVQRDIAGSRLLTVDGDGHTGILHSSCARTRMAAYLVDGTLPPPGTVCPATETTPATSSR